MASLGSRRGSAENFTLPLMILAFLTVGGFLYWLNITAEPTQVVIEEGPEVRESGASAILDAQDFLVAPAEYEGQVVEVTGARISSRLGTQAFWIGPDDRPFLVKMGAGLVADSTRAPVLVEQMVTIVGTVYTMTDSALAAWDSAGAFANEGDKIVAEFAVGSPILEARTIDVQGPAGGDGSGSAGN